MFGLPSVNIAIWNLKSFLPFRLYRWRLSIFISMLLISAMFYYCPSLGSCSSFSFFCLTFPYDQRTGSCMIKALSLELPVACEDLFNNSVMSRFLNTSSQEKLLKAWYPSATTQFLLFYCPGVLTSLRSPGWKGQLGTQTNSVLRMNFITVASRLNFVLNKSSKHPVLMDVPRRGAAWKTVLFTSPLLTSEVERVMNRLHIKRWSPLPMDYRFEDGEKLTS